VSPWRDTSVGSDKSWRLDDIVAELAAIEDDVVIYAGTTVLGRVSIGWVPKRPFSI
jgi:hypothetical protein